MAKLFEYPRLLQLEDFCLSYDPFTNEAAALDAKVFDACLSITKEKHVSEIEAMGAMYVAGLVAKDFDTTMECLNAASAMCQNQMEALLHDHSLLDRLSKFQKRIDKQIEIQVESVEAWANAKATGTEEELQAQCVMEWQEYDRARKDKAKKLAEAEDEEMAGLLKTMEVDGPGQSRAEDQLAESSNASCPMDTEEQ